MHEILGPKGSFPDVPVIAATRVFYVRLGQGARAARSCLEADEIGLAYEKIPHDMCVQDRWDSVRTLFLQQGKTPGAAANHVRELRTFYEAGPDVLWITFADGRMWWAFAVAPVRWAPELTGQLPRRRKTLSPWRSTDLHGADLTIQNLHRKLTSVAGFQGALCEVAEARYVIDKINGQSTSLADEALAARAKLENITKRLIQQLHEKDFELLVDLIFTGSGWRRVSVLGEIEADVDLIVEQPLTRERVWVQVKSKAAPGVLRDYVERLRIRGAERVVFACHSPSPALANLESDLQDGVELWLGDLLAAKALRAGLVDWLIERAC